MLKERTKGNLNPEEDRFLTNLLKDLKLNYVDEANKPDGETSKAEPPATGEGPNEIRHHRKPRQTRAGRSD